MTATFLSLFICFFALGVYATPIQEQKCGGNLFDTFGEIKTPNWPRRWREDTIDCVWTITAPTGYNVRLTFLDFTLEDFFGECSTDKLSVHDGPHITSPTLGKVLCGTDTPEVITSNKQSVTLYLTSTEDATYGSGFKVQYDIVPDTNPDDCAINTCGGLLVDRPHCLLQSPSYPHSYPANQTCEWQLETSGNQPITIDISDMKFYQPDGADGCSINHITVYDGLSTNSKVLLQPSCVKEEGELLKVTSSGKTMLIVMETGGKKGEGEGASDFEHHYRGFSMDVEMPGAPIPPPTTTPPIGGGNPATSPPSPNPAAVSGVVIGTIVGLVVVVFGVLVFIAFVHWRRQNHRFNIRLRDEDSNSDNNTLISSADFEDEPDLKKQKKKGKIVRVTENDLRQAGVYEL